MNRNRLHIAIIAQSQIIFEGLHSVISQSDLDTTICKVEILDELDQIIHSRPIDILIINPILLANREKDVKRLRRKHPKLSIIGINTGLIDNMVMSLLDESFSLFDSAKQIMVKLQKAADGNELNNSNTENLTDREIDVLTNLVHGMSNKEIAESLNISIHTVVTHRKNITAKTGIRSQSGLTIYAISKKIIDLGEINPFA